MQFGLAVRTIPKNPFAACNARRLLFAFRSVPHDDERLFERFRRGDAAALGELFDRVAPALLRAALHLASDPGGAEDLVQSTFLRAIEVRDEWDGRRPLVPWLYGILHNRARHDRWQQGRVPDPARLPAPPPLDPVRATQSAEFDAAVDAAIADLPEIYRPVLRLHLAYGHQPAEIAHALERPPGTVRSQLARGLEALRKRLPAGFAGGALLLMTTGRGLAAVREVIATRAALAVPTVVAASAIGGSVVMKKLVAAGALAVIAIGSWFVWRSDEKSPSPREEVSPPRAVSVEVDGIGPAPAGGLKPASERTPALPPNAPTTGELHLTCRFEDDGSLARGVRLNITPWRTRDGELLQRTARTSTDGVVVVADLPVGEVWIVADRGGSLRADIPAGDTVAAELTIPKGIDVRGRVVDADGAPAPGAQVWLSRGAHDYCDGAFVATADAGGRFYLRSVEPERFLSATAAGFRSAAVRPVRGEIGTASEVTLLLENGGASLFGLVLDGSGAPVAEARVYVGSKFDALRWTPELMGGHRPPVELVTAPDGTFAVHGLPPGSQQPVWIRAVGSCAWYQTVQLEADRDTVVTARLEPGASLGGRVTDRAGAPVGGAYVRYRSSAWCHEKLEFDAFRGPDWSHSGAVTDADGSYHIDCITPGRLRLWAQAGDLEARGEIAVGPGETGSWDPVLVELAIRGRVVDERGTAMAGIAITAYPPRSQGNLTTATTDAEGRFSCRVHADTPYVLKFRTAPHETTGEGGRLAVTLRGVEAAPDEVLVRIPDAAVPRAVIVGRLLDTDGNPPANGSVRCSGEGLHLERSTTADATTGEFRLGPLPTGRFRLQGSCEKSRRRSGWGDAILLTGDEVRNVGILQMPETGTIAVTAVGPDGAPLEAGSVALESSTGWSEASWLAGKLDAGGLRIEGVAPGSYRVRVGGGRDLPDVYEPVTVIAGEEVNVQVRVPPGVHVELVLSPVTEPVPIEERFVWMRDGALFERYDNRLEGHAELNWSRCLLPGNYEVTVTSETGQRAQNQFVIGADDPPGRRIPIRLP